MYYIPELFTKRGSLGKVWLAGTDFKKLSKKQVQVLNVLHLCEIVQNPAYPIELPARARLVLGIARVYEKQLHYIYLEAISARAVYKAKESKASVNLTKSGCVATREFITLEADDASLTRIDASQFAPLNFGYGNPLSWSNDDSNGPLLRAAHEFQLDQVSSIALVDPPTVSLALDSLPAFSDDDITSLNMNDIHFSSSIDGSEWMNPYQSSIEGTPTLTSGHENKLGMVHMDTSPSLMSKKRKKYDFVDKTTEMTSAAILKRIQDASDLICDRPLKMSKISEGEQAARALDRPSLENLSNPLTAIWEECVRQSNLASDAEAGHARASDTAFGSVKRLKGSSDSSSDVEIPRFEVSHQDSFLGFKLSRQDRSTSSRTPSISPLRHLNDWAREDSTSIRMPTSRKVERFPASPLDSATTIFESLVTKEVQAARQQKTDKISFRDILYRNARSRVRPRDAAIAFQQLLILKSANRIQVEQKDTLHFSPIFVSQE